MLLGNVFDFVIWVNCGWFVFVEGLKKVVVCLMRSVFKLMIGLFWGMIVKIGIFKMIWFVNNCDMEFFDLGLFVEWIEMFGEIIVNCLLYCC